MPRDVTDVKPFAVSRTVHVNPGNHGVITLKVCWFQYLIKLCSRGRLRIQGRRSD